MKPFLLKTLSCLSIFLIFKTSCETISCDFEIDLCGYEYDDAEPDTYERFIRYTGKSPSVTSGPFADRTEDGYYALCDARKLIDVNRKCIMKQSITELTAEMSFKFWYYMWGSQIGTLELILNNENPIWSKSDRQSNEWLSAELILPIGTKMIEFSANRSSLGRVSSDIAIDDIEIDDIKSTTSIISTIEDITESSFFSTEITSESVANTEQSSINTYQSTIQNEITTDELTSVSPILSTEIITDQLTRVSPGLSTAITPESSETTEESSMKSYQSTIQNEITTDRFSSVSLGLSTEISVLESSYSTMDSSSTPIITSISTSTGALNRTFRTPSTTASSRDSSTILSTERDQQTTTSKPKSSNDSTILMIILIPLACITILVASVFVFKIIKRKNKTKAAKIELKLKEINNDE